MTDTDEFVPCPRHGTRCYPEFRDDLAQRIECAVGLGDSGADGVRATRDRIMWMIEDHDAADAVARDALRARLAATREAADEWRAYALEHRDEPNPLAQAAWRGMAHALCCVLSALDGAPVAARGGGRAGATQSGRDMTRYAHPERRDPPRRRRCRTRHSADAPARCRRERGHEGGHWFGWWGGRDLDLAVEVFDGPARVGPPENFED